MPVPEEVLLLLVGYIAAPYPHRFYWFTLAAILGIIAGDNFLFWLSRLGRGKIVAKIKSKLKQSQVMKYRSMMSHHIGKTIFITRFIIGLRIFGPFLAGSLKVRWKKFQFFNFLAVIIYAPLMVFLGYHFHNDLVLLIGGVELVRHTIFFISLALISWLVGMFLKKKFINKKPVI